MASWVDLATGSSIDWVYATQNVSLAYTFEFRDEGNLIIKFVDFVAINCGFDLLLLNL